MYLEEEKNATVETVEAKALKALKRICTKNGRRLSAFLSRKNYNATDKQIAMEDFRLLSLEMLLSYQEIGDLVGKTPATVGRYVNQRKNG